MRVLLLGLALASLAACRPESHLPQPQKDGPEVVGSEKFSNQVHEALQLLKEHDADAHAMVRTYVGRIQEGERSGMWAYRTPPTYVMSERTAMYSVTWCAATIAHDAFHSKLYHDHLKAHDGPVPHKVWTGPAAERLCMAHQMAVMKRIGASQWEMDHALKNADGHYAKDNETWAEYEKKNW